MPGSISAAKSDGWTLVSIKPKKLYRTKVLANGDEQLQAARQWTLVRQQKHYGVTAFTESTNDTTSSFSLGTGPDSSLTYSSTGKTFRCTDDSLDVVQDAVGEYVQRQVWEWRGEYEDVAEGEF